MARPQHRTTPHVIASRLAPDELRAARMVAEARGESLSTFTRHAVALLANGETEPDPVTRRNVCSALRIPPNSADAEILQAVKALLASGMTELPTVELSTAALYARALEQSSRFGLVSELVKLGAETATTAWAGAGDARRPAKHLADKSIVELRARVSALRAKQRK